MAFEVSESYANLWALCRELGKVPGLIFPDHSRKAGFFTAPPVCEFLFQSARYKIYHMNDGFWIGPAKDGAVLAPTESLLIHIRCSVTYAAMSSVTAGTGYSPSCSLARMGANSSFKPKPLGGLA